MALNQMKKYWSKPTQTSILDAWIGHWMSQDGHTNWSPRARRHDADTAMCQQNDTKDD